MLLVLVAYRLIAPGSEWRLHRQWFERSALADLLGADFAHWPKSHKLYALPRSVCWSTKQALFDHLTGAGGICSMPDFDVLLYDLTSTYFECRSAVSERATNDGLATSRDKRPDCVQVVIALVVTPRGLSAWPTK